MAWLTVPAHGREIRSELPDLDEGSEPEETPMLSGGQASPRSTSISLESGETIHAGWDGSKWKNASRSTFDWASLLHSDDLSERLQGVRSLWEQKVRNPTTPSRTTSTPLNSNPEEQPPLVLSRRPSPRSPNKTDRIISETPSTSHEAINVSHPGQVSALLRRATATTRSPSPEDSSGEETSGIIQQLAYLQAEDDELEILHRSLRDSMVINISSQQADWIDKDLERWTKKLEQAVKKILRKNSVQVLRRATLRLWNRKIVRYKHRTILRMSQRIQSRFTMAAWCQWHKRYKKARRERQLMHKVTCRFRHRLLFKTLLLWVQNTKESTEMRCKTKRVMRCWAQGALVRCLNSWNKHINEQTRARAAIARVVNRMRRKISRFISLVMTRWCENVKELRALRNIGARVVNRKSNITLVRSLDAWRVHTAEEGRKRAILARVVKRMKLLVVVGALKRWEKLLRQCKRTRGIMETVMHRMIHKRACRAVDTWRCTAQKPRSLRANGIKAAIQWSNTMLLRVFDFWRLLAAERQRKRIGILLEAKASRTKEERRKEIMTRMLARMTKRLLSSSMARWCESLKKSRALHRMMTLLLVRSLDAWRGRTEEKLRRRIGMRRVVGRVRPRLLASGWERWGEQLRQGKRSRAIMAKVIHRMTKMLLVRGLDGWRGCTEANLRRRVSMRRVVKRMRLRELVGGWERWREQLKQGKRSRAIMAKVIQRIKCDRKQGVCAAFDKWRCHVQELRSVRGKGLKALTRWANMALIRSLEAWREHTAVQLRGRVISKRTLARMMNLCISSAMARWSEHLKERMTVRAKEERKKAILARVVKHMTHRRLVRAWERWGEQLRQGKRSRAIMAKVIHRMTKMLLVRGLDGWRGCTEANLRRRVSMRRVVKRMRLRELVGGWERWREQLKQGKRSRAIMAKVIQRIKCDGVCAAFDTWRCHVQELRSVRGKGFKALTRWANMALIRSLEAWREHTAVQLRGRVISKRTLARMTNLCISSAMARWSEHLKERMTVRAKEDRKKAILARVVKHMTHHRLVRAWERWGEQLRQGKRSRAIMAKVIHRMTKMLLVRGLDGWRGRTEANLRRRVSMRRVVKRMRLRELVGGWERWREQLRQGKRSRAIMAKVIQRIKCDGVCAAFDTWRCHVQELRSVRGKGLKALTRWANMALIRSLDAWRGHMAKEQRKHNMVSIVFNRFLRNHLIVSWNRWVAFWQDCGHQRQILMQVIGRCGVADRVLKKCVLLQWSLVGLRSMRVNQISTRHTSRFMHKLLLEWSSMCWRNRCKRSVCSVALMQEASTTLSLALAAWQSEAHAHRQASRKILKKSIVAWLSSNAIRGVAHAVQMKTISDREISTEKATVLTALLHWRHIASRLKSQSQAVVHNVHSRNAAMVAISHRHTRWILQVWRLLAYDSSERRVRRVKVQARFPATVQRTALTRWKHICLTCTRLLHSQVLISRKMLMSLSSKAWTSWCRWQDVQNYVGENWAGMITACVLKMQFTRKMLGKFKAMQYAVSKKMGIKYRKTLVVNTFSALKDSVALFIHDAHLDTAVLLHHNEFLVDVGKLYIVKKAGQFVKEWRKTVQSCQWFRHCFFTMAKLLLLQCRHEVRRPKIFAASILKRKGACKFRLQQTVKRMMTVWQRFTILRFQELACQPWHGRSARMRSCMDIWKAALNYRVALNAPLEMMRRSGDIRLSSSTVRAWQSLANYFKIRRSDFGSIVRKNDRRIMSSTLWVWGYVTCTGRMMRLKIRRSANFFVKHLWGTLRIVWVHWRQAKRKGRMTRLKTQNSVRGYGLRLSCVYIRAWHSLTPYLKRIRSCYGSIVHKIDRKLKKETLLAWEHVKGTGRMMRIKLERSSSRPRIRLSSSTFHAWHLLTNEINGIRSEYASMVRKKNCRLMIKTLRVWGRANHTERMMRFTHDAVLKRSFNVYARHLWTIVKNMWLHWITVRLNKRSLRYIGALVHRRHGRLDACKYFALWRLNQFRHSSSGFVNYMKGTDCIEETSSRLLSGDSKQGYNLWEDRPETDIDEEVYDDSNHDQVLNDASSRSKDHEHDTSSMPIYISQESKKPNFKSSDVGYMPHAAKDGRPAATKSQVPNEMHDLQPRVLTTHFVEVDVARSISTSPSPVHLNSLKTALQVSNSANLTTMTPSRFADLTPEALAAWQRKIAKAQNQSDDYSSSEEEDDSVILKSSLIFSEDGDGGGRGGGRSISHKGKKISEMKTIKALVHVRSSPSATYVPLSKRALGLQTWVEEDERVALIAATFARRQCLRAISSTFALWASETDVARVTKHRLWCLISISQQRLFGGQPTVHTALMGTASIVHSNSCLRCLAGHFKLWLKKIERCTIMRLNVSRFSARRDFRQTKNTIKYCFYVWLRTVHSTLATSRKAMWMLARSEGLWMQIVVSGWHDWLVRKKHTNRRADVIQERSRKFRAGHHFASWCTDHFQQKRLISILARHGKNRILLPAWSTWKHRAQYLRSVALISRVHCSRKVSKNMRRNFTAWVQLVQWVKYSRQRAMHAGFHCSRKVSKNMRKILMSWFQLAQRSKQLGVHYWRKVSKNKRKILITWFQLAQRPIQVGVHCSRKVSKNMRKILISWFQLAQRSEYWRKRTIQLVGLMFDYSARRMRSSYWCTWRDLTHRGKHRVDRLAVEKCLAKWMYQGMVQAFDAWHAQRVQQRRARERAHRRILRVSNVALSRAFVSWRENKVLANDLARKGQCVFLRSRRLLLACTLSHWHAIADYKNMNTKNRSQCIGVVDRKFMRCFFLVWREFMSVSEIKAYIAGVAKMRLARFARCFLIRHALFSWHRLVKNCGQARHELMLAQYRRIRTLFQDFRHFLAKRALRTRLGGYLVTCHRARRIRRAWQVWTDGFIQDRFVDNSRPYTYGMAKEPMGVFDEKTKLSEAYLALSPFPRTYARGPYSSPSTTYGGR